MTVKHLSILGSTGSIGVSTLDVVRRHPERYRVVALSAGRNVEILAQQVREFRPTLVSVQDAASAKALAEKIGDLRCEIHVGEDGALRVAKVPDTDTVVSAMVGAVGLRPTHAAICAGKVVALANKETLVMAGRCMTEALKKHNTTLLPIDSEHSAILQCLQGQRHDHVRRVILTASGGPFRDRPAGSFAQITKVEALKHPNWSMGAKITIDSATMMNKGLELIEAMWLFDLRPEQVDIVIHPQSIIHSMVEYCDGSVMAQLSTPDMRGPIAYALSYPDRVTSGIARVDFKELSQLTFEMPDSEKFPALRIARQVAVAGGTAPAVMNAANEVAVAAFLNDAIPFLRMAQVVEEVMQRHAVMPCITIEDALEADKWARRAAQTLL